MGIEALTYRKDGTPVDVPRSREDWQQWVSAGRTRNWMLDNPLLDWLDLYGKEKGYQPDENGPNNPTELDFLPFIIRQGRRFEEGILRLLQKRYEVTIIADDARDIRDLAKAEETFAALHRGDLIIHQAVLWDAEHTTYGAPDFLIRSDVLRKLFPNDISKGEACIPAPDLGDVDGTTAWWTRSSPRWSSMRQGTSCTTAAAGQPIRRNCTSTIRCWGDSKATCHRKRMFWDGVG